jgi:hypothetical protein
MKSGAWAASFAALFVVALLVSYLTLPEEPPAGGGGLPPLTAHATPASGPTPGVFTVEVSGSPGPVTLQLDRSPPNMSPMPAVIITQRADGNFDVEISDSLPADVDVYLTATDSHAQTATAVFRSD